MPITGCEQNFVPQTNNFKCGPLILFFIRQTSLRIGTVRAFSKAGQPFVPSAHPLAGPWAIKMSVSSGILRLGCGGAEGETCHKTHDQLGRSTEKNLQSGRIWKDGKFRDISLSWFVQMPHVLQQFAAYTIWVNMGDTKCLDPGHSWPLHELVWTCLDLYHLPATLPMVINPRI